MTPNRDPRVLPPPLTREEIARYRELSITERAALLAETSRATAEWLREQPDAQEVADFVEPLPESSLRALEKLRAEYRGARDRARR